MSMIVVSHHCSPLLGATMNSSTPGPCPGLMREKQAADWIGVTVRFLQQSRVTGRGPKYVHLSRRAIRYRPQDLEEWVKSRLRTSTSEKPDSEDWPKINPKD